MKFPRARLLVFCKAPEPGRVKTRLIPLLGAQGAARLQARLLDNCLARVTAAGLCPVALHCDPDTEHEQFVKLRRQYRVSTVAQSGYDLGERMSHALQLTLGSADAVLLIGADCPGLRGADLELALAQLYTGSDVVLGPACDGGYYLVGLRRHLPELFMAMPWGTADVFAITRQRAAGLGLSVSCLPRYRDIDTPDDYLAWRRQYTGRAVVEDQEPGISGW